MSIFFPDVDFKLVSDGFAPKNNAAISISTSLMMRLLFALKVMKKCNISIKKSQFSLESYSKIDATVVKSVFYSTTYEFETFLGREIPEKS